MREITRLNFTNEENLPSFSSTVEIINSLKRLHNLDEVYLWPMIERQIDFDKMDPENVTETPYKEWPVISIRAE